MSIPALRRDLYFQSPSRVVVSRTPHQERLGQHRHEFLEIAIILSGEGVHVTGKLRHKIATGDILVLSRRRPHGYENTFGLNVVNILIRENSLPRLARDLRQLPGFQALFTLESLRWNQEHYLSHLRLNSDDLQQVNEWVNLLEAETHSSGPGGAVLAEAYLILIMGLLSRRYGTSARLAARPEGEMGRLLSWLEANLHLPLTAPMLAERAGMSERTFHRRLKAATGLTPMEFVLRQRMLRAAELLGRGSVDRISEVADRCGFADSNYFSRCFRAHHQCSPSDYLQKSPLKAKRIGSSGIGTNQTPHKLIRGGSPLLNPG